VPPLALSLCYATATLQMHPPTELKLTNIMIHVWESTEGEGKGATKGAEAPHP